MTTARAGSRSRRFLAAAAPIVLGLAPLVGCAKSTATLTGRPVSLAAFTRPPQATFETEMADAEPAGAEVSGAELSGAELSGAELSGAELSGADPAGLDPAGTAARPLAAAGPGFAGDAAGDAASVAGSLRGHRLKPGERVLVESLVGQVNGQPIFAEQFFEPIQDQLIALSKQARGEQFAIEASALVSAELRQVVLNALFLAEAESALTVEEKKGIRAWLAQLERRVIAGYGGSRERADRAIRESEDQSIDEHLGNMKDRALMQKLVQEKIAPRVIVSWRDIEREYERRAAEFNPPPKVTLARIRVPTARVEVIEEVSLRLDAGADFLEVAASIGAGNGKWQTFEVEDGDLSKVEIANQTLVDAMAPLNETGDRIGPFELGATTWWLYVVEFDRPPARDLYDPDVQRILATAIRRARGGEEQDRYIASLLERGIFDELEEMGQRLVRIAIRRYGQ